MLRVVGCILEYDGKFVLLFRHAHKPHGNTWGLPAGKVEPNETDEAAIIREVYEETGYKTRASELEYLREDIFQFDGDPFVFVVYRVTLARPYSVKTEESAHRTHRWVSPREGYAITNLIPGLHKVFELVGYY